MRRPHFPIYSMRPTALGLLVLALLLNACGMPQSAEEFDRTPEAVFLKATMDRLVARDYDVIESQMDARVHQADLREAIRRTVSLIPPEAPIKLEPVGWGFRVVKSLGRRASGSRVANVAIEYTYPGPKRVVASATLSGEPGNFRILAFNVAPIPAPLAELNAFTFKGKGPAHYASLFLTMVAFGVSVFAFVRCIRTPGVKRKWLWAIFTLVGVGAVSLDWTTGAVFANLFSFNLFSAEIMRAGWTGPWIISFCFPLGALIFLWRFRKPALNPGVSCE